VGRLPDGDKGIDHLREIFHPKALENRGVLRDDLLLFQTFPDHFLVVSSLCVFNFILDWSSAPRIGIWPCILLFFSVQNTGIYVLQFTTKKNIENPQSPPFCCLLHPFAT